MIRAVIGAVALAMPLCAAAQSWKMPPESQRCPSKWGANDERGSMNHQKPAAVMNATRLIKTGEVIELAHVLGPSMAFFGTRRFDVHAKRTFMNQFSNMRGSNEELVVTELGQVGTQFDGFAHQTHLDSWYNCFKVSENATRSGFSKLGVEKVGMVMTRGVLIDVAALKGVDMLPDTYEITVQDLQQALERQKVKLQPGDAVLIHTGWGKLYGKDNPRYVKTCPGVGVAGRGMARQAGPDPRRRRQLAGGGRAQPGPAAQPAGPPDLPRGERHPPAGEREARRAGGEEGLRVRLRHAAAQDAGRVGVHGVAGRHPLGSHRWGTTGARRGEICPATVQVEP